MIDQTDNESDSVFYHIDDYIVKQLITDHGMTETVATDLYYASKTYMRLIDESTDLYLKSWTDIYKLFLTELKIKN
jgi:AraC-like DNA-binding protein